MSQDPKLPAVVEEPTEVELMFDERHRKQQAQFSDAADLINTHAVERLRKITEEVFLNQLLPVIRKQVRNEPSDDMGLWIHIADGFDSPILVIPRTAKTEADLFICPSPFLRIAPLVPDRNQRYIDLRNIIMHQRALLINSDERKAIEVELDLVKTLYPNPGDDVRMTALVQLISIYLRYDLPMEELLGPQYQEILDLIKDQPGGESSTPPTEPAVPAYVPNDSDWEF